MFEAARHPRTDDPLVGRAARWLGNPDLPDSVPSIPLGTVGTVTGWQLANGEQRQYLVDFDFEDGGGVTWYTSLPDPAIELV